MKARVWFRAQGARMAGWGLPLQASPLWPCRNEMPTWAWYSFTEGYTQNRRPA